MTVRRALVVTALAVATACSRGPGGRLHATAPGDDDLALASRAVGEYRRRVRPSSDAAAVARLARVSGALVDAAKAGTARDRAAALPWNIVLVESPNSNVATFSNGTIFVDAGLLRLVPTDDALAGALGQAIVRPLLHEESGRGGRVRGGDMLDFGGGASRVDRATRDSEEADYEGLVLAVDAGYDPELAVGAFDQLGLRERGEAAREHLPALKERHAQR